MFRRMLILAALVSLWTQAAQAQFAQEDATDSGIVNPTDFSWRAFLDQMRQFPDRLGAICGNAYLLDKGGNHDDADLFFRECAARGNVPSMVYLAYLYEQAWPGHPVQLEKSAYWLAKAAESDYPLAKFHWGVALLLGRGVPIDAQAGKSWIIIAAKQGNQAAQDVIDAGFRVTIEGKPLPQSQLAPLSLTHDYISPRRAQP